MAMRYDNWKFVFLEQRAEGTLRVWAEPFTVLRFPKIFNLRTDRFERADITSNTYDDWGISHAYLLVPAQAYVMQMAASLVEFPPSQESASFTIGNMIERRLLRPDRPWLQLTIIVSRLRGRSGLCRRAGPAG